MAGACVALIGGGRWGRVHASVLGTMSPRIGRVLWVTQHNKPALDAFLAQSADASAPRFDVCTSLDAALAEGPTAAIVVTAAVDHASTTARLLGSGVPTLVEKPLALSSRDAMALVELAEGRGLVLCVGLHLLMAPFLQDFRRTWAGRSVRSMRVEWLDPAVEMRHGEAKAINLGTHKADEVVPHLWSILTSMVEGHEPGLRSVTPQPLGAVTLEIDVGPVRATALLARRAAERGRRIELAFADGGSASLDFAREPGGITIDGVRRQQDASQGDRPGPLAAEVSAFLDLVDRPHGAQSSPQLARRCLGSVTLAEAAHERLIDVEAEAVAGRLAAGASVQDADVSAWIVDNIAPLLGLEGVRISAADRDVQIRIVEAAEQFILGSVSGDPLQPEGSRPDALAAAIRGSEFMRLAAKHYAQGHARAGADG
jgi:predicted dehydrogenase